MLTSIFSKLWQDFQYFQYSRMRSSKTFFDKVKDFKYMCSISVLQMLNLLEIWSTCTSTSRVPTDFIRIEKRDRSTLGRRVASAKRIATDMIPSITAKPFSTCFLKMHRQKNSAKKQHLFRILLQMLLICVCVCVCVSFLN